ncbi:hypothetical protein Hanom_Chr09g00834601 [Helianthus anomalus]
MEAVLIRDILIEAMLSLPLKRKNNLKELVLFLIPPPKIIGQQQVNRATTRELCSNKVVTWVGRSNGRCVDRNSGEQGRGQGVNQGSVLGSSDTIGLQYDAPHHILMSSHIEDGDDVSSVHVTSTRRGSASQLQVLEPKNREWIYIQDGKFSNQTRSTRVYWSKSKEYVDGPWESWKDIPNEDKKRLFERFQWEEKWNVEIYMCWERCIAGKSLIC